LLCTSAVQADWLSVEDAQDGTNLRIWASTGEEKIPQEQLRAFAGETAGTTNSVWDGQKISTYAAKNEIVSFAVVVENGGTNEPQITPVFSSVSNGTYTLATTDFSTSSLHDWRNRPIEVFTVDYLQVLGLSKIGYELYDETHIPEALRRPYTSNQPTTPAIGEGVSRFYDGFEGCLGWDARHFSGAGEFWA